MIIVKLIGGLGNQMFQYATARRLAFKHDTALILDLSSFETYKLHNYALNHFNINAQIAIPKQLGLCRSDSRLSRLRRIFLRSNSHDSNYIKEKNFNFDREILELSDNVYLDGYWQSEKYFKDIENIIKKEFRLEYELDEKNREMADYISNCESVSIHVRRGDYVTNSVINAFHGTCDMDYYLRCISLLKNKIKDPHFFIFSDDPEWVKINLNIDFPTIFITHNGPEKNYEDLKLMSLCKHNIIANSSFSWWGAWLNDNPQKIVIGPLNWFRDNKINTRDLMPEYWNRL